MKEKRYTYIFFSIFIVTLSFLSGCTPKEEETYKAEFFELFDTKTVVMGYAKDEETFYGYVEVIYDELEKLHKEFDIYHTYPDRTNLKTINKNPQEIHEVSDEIIELLEESVKGEKLTKGAVNPVLGPVLSIWHEYREEGLKGNGELPPLEELEEANKLTDINKLLIKDNHIKMEEGMALDVGAIAKGFAAEKAAEKAVKAGFTFGIINVGGNTVVLDTVEDNDFWKVGIRDAHSKKQTDLIDTVKVKNKSVVTSGDYERYYVVDNKNYHHVIDPKTLFPSENFSSVTIIHSSSTMADLLSTALFILPLEEGEEIAKSQDAEVLWQLKDGTVHMTDGYREMSENFSKE